MKLPFMDHLLQEMNTRLLVAQDRYVAQYITPKQLVHQKKTTKRSGSLEGKMGHDECR